MTGMAGQESTSIRRHLHAGIALLAVLASSVGGWAATTEISGAVIAYGTLVVDSNVKRVQHPTGGVVGEILVHDGVRVSKGDVLVRLDETITRANLAIVVKGLQELRARKSRLASERDGLDAVAFPDDLLAELPEAPDLAGILSGERKLFDLRRSARLGQKSQLRQRIVQLGEEIGGLTAQVAAKGQEIVLIQRELVGARELWDKGLMPITKMTALEREAARLEGERAQLEASVAQSRGRIIELELQITQIDRDLASEVGRELREVDAKIGELIERKVAGEDQLKRTDIRAPQDGTVHQSSVHTVGGVISPGEPIMLIVPAADALAVEARVAPHEIDQVRLGQKSLLRFTAFNQRTTPEINGKVSRVAADATADQRTAVSYYTIRISVSSEELARLEDVKLMPGMPVETFIQTADRNVISYLLKPVSDQLKRAFRER
jgi:HlyD family secretion protein